MNSKDRYELDYWEAVLSKDFRPRYEKVIELFGIGKVKSILEWGCGPFGGVLPYVDALIKYGYDPLADEYRKLSYYPFIFNEVPDIKFDCILTVNAIDHGDSDFSVIKTLMNLLNDNGNLYIHVHLRRDEQLNSGHDHQLTYDDFVRETEGLTIISFKIHGIDPLPASNDPNIREQYTALMAHIRK